MKGKPRPASILGIAVTWLLIAGAVPVHGQFQRIEVGEDVELSMKEDTRLVIEFQEVSASLLKKG